MKLVTSIFLLSLLLVAVESKRNPWDTEKPKDPHPTTLKSNLIPYNGGKVIQNVKVVSIMWGGEANVRDGSRWESFYQAITNSDYMDWLTEYNTPTQEIGRGSHIL
jgi:hypothetical protein